MIIALLQSDIVIESHESEFVDAATRKREAAALYKLWKQRARRSQQAFATERNWTQGNVAHYLHGRRPLNIFSAMIFASELDIGIEEFSPRLAEIEEQKRKEALRRRWPFRQLSREDWSSLTDGQKLELEGMVLRRIEEWRAAPDKSPSESQATN